MERLTGTKVGIEADRTDSRLPSISADGRFVAFQSRIANFVTPDTNDSIDVFVKDLVTGEFSLKSSTPAGVQGDGDSTFPSLSADGRSVAFLSSANSLAPGKTSFNADVFLVTTAPPTASSLDELASLTTSLGALTPGFSPAVTAYAQNAASETEFVQVRPVAAAPGTTVSVRVGAGSFSPVESGAISPELPLATGNNTIEVRTTAPDGTTGRTYSLTAVRARSSNAGLAGLSLGSAEVLPLAPGFVPGTKAYAATAPGDAAFVRVSPVAAHPNATVTVNGVTVPAGSSSTPIPLAFGNNTLTTLVTAEDGTTKASYVVVVTRAPGSNADLAGLLLSVEPTSGFFPFNRFQTDYTVNVASGTVSLALTPTADEAAAKLKINGQPVASGTTSGAIPLAFGINLLTVTVTAQDDTTVKNYVVTVTRAAAQANTPPVALPQTVQVAAGTSAAITLAGSDADGNPLTFAVLTQPTKGVLSGTAPSLTYVPTSATAATDSFTFKVNDGIADSPAATVSIQITDSPPPAAEVSISMVNGRISIQFTGTLQSSGQVEGPYTPVTGATSPFIVTPDNAAKFYIAR